MVEHRSVRARVAERHVVEVQRVLRQPACLRALPLGALLGQRCRGSANLVLEPAHRVVRVHAELRLRVGLRVVLAEPHGGESRLEGDRQLGQRDLPAGGGPSRCCEERGKHEQPEGGVAQVGLEVDAPPLAPHRGHPAQVGVAVALAEPVGQPEDPHLLRRGRLDACVAEVDDLAPDLGIPLEHLGVLAQAAAVARAEDGRCEDQRGGRPPGEDGADQDGTTQELEVAGDEGEQAGAGLAG